MATKALRQKILDLAIRGKLVPQDPNDEPASVLLERIREQKQQMVKEGKLKKKDIKNDSVIFVGEDNLHYEKSADGSMKCIEDEIPFELPEGWAWTRLGCITDVIQYGLSNSAESTGDYRLLRITDIQNGCVNWDTVPFTYTDEPEKYLLHKDDIVFARTGATVGKSFLITDLPYVSVYASYLIRIRLINGISANYIYHFFNSYCYWEQVTDKSVGVGQPNCNGTALKELFIPLPSQAEQNRIVPVADNLLKIADVITSERESLSELIQTTKSKILDLAIRGKLVPQNSDDEPASVLLERIKAEKEELIKQGKIKRDKKESIIFKGEDNSYYQRVEAEGATIIHRVDVPSTWEVCHLQDISYPISSIGMQIKSEEIQNDGLFPVISQGKSYIDGYCSDESKVIYDFPIILFGDHTRNVKYIDFPFIVGADGTKLHKIIQANEKYVYYWMCHASEHIADRGYARHYNLLQKKCFMLPPFAEQNRIVNCIEKLFAQLNSICDALS